VLQRWLEHRSIPDNSLIDGVLWLTVVGLGWIYTLWKGHREQSTESAISAAGRIFAGIWLATGFAFTLMYFIGISFGSIPSNSAQGITATVLGIPMLARPGAYTLLVEAALFLLLMAVPGIIFLRQRPVRSPQP